MLTSIVKANVDFALSAMLPPKLLSLDADTAKMELTSALRLANWERNIVELVLGLVACNLNNKKLLTETTMTNSSHSAALVIWCMENV